MKVEADKVVQFHYRLNDSEGNELESSYDNDPVAYLHGHNNMIPGLEMAMTDREQGTRFSTVVVAKDGYGERVEGSEQRIPIKHLLVKKKSLLMPGAVVSVNTENGPRPVTIIKSGRFNVDVDTNHPFAGMDLHYDIEIIDVRDASDEEKAHGHAHGVGGHHH
ncbi:FKBP-type peptidyl-prolyl cis-trans isomerase [Aestuariirhabdus sp. Z084]|uniref:FKBP-type peptidyl-prolyl cis-trans isomerase n=1 Tax=Aestuariirhabdus haliotis TaxID=2918751 RepID=UPI00201B3A6F|nr:FKBP-type peptidyl-prolyl cis-trans isomerase [Aestuariirhabdus haliotis]MCL6415532.1 FKBP-type peptidyl-prolyl cis-trans isomerase [Aestuariirhabdus haliotis]MCL6419263.1 FKBP-type peptidyl-prolyl cis-trans isomerase [Aestuariirhabdus haliotis]